MDHHHHHRRSTAVTILTFFLLLARGATSRISFDLSPATADASSNTGDSNSNIVLPTEITKSESNDDVMNHESEIENEKEKEKDRMFRVDLTPRTDFARFHAINRHFFDKPRVPIRSDSDHSHHHFMNPFVIPRPEISHEKTGNVNVEILHRRAPAKKKTKVRHDNGHRHHRHNHRHNHNHNHLHLHHGNNGGSVSKRVFDHENMKSNVYKHKEEKRVHESGFMKRIRKFLEHTFE